MQARALDPRYLQIGVLSCLLGYGIHGLDFEVNGSSAFLVIACALATQFAFSRWNRQAFDPRSPLISALSLCLLLRAADPGLLCLGATIAVASKFLIRASDKHVFNPTNFAIVVLLVSTDSVWVSPGQWGAPALGGAAFVLAGAMVLRRAERSDVTLAFLFFWGAILFGRSFWLGEPMTIPFHQLESGGLLLFAFFMLSDPRTTPDSRSGRIAFAATIALIAGFIQFVLFEQNGLLIALAICAPLVPVADRLLPGLRFVWPGSALAPPARASVLSLQSTLHSSVQWKRSIQ
jgi:Na+-transporting NADH:ubiquinone oxidoreductase subunit NqrB